VFYLERNTVVTADIGSHDLYRRVSSTLNEAINIRIISAGVASIRKRRNDEEGTWKKTKCCESTSSQKVSAENTRNSMRGEVMSLCWNRRSEVFPNAEAVNSSLRSLAEIIRRRKSLAEK
jgi:hypothetical protein